MHNHPYSSKLLFKQLNDKDHYNSCEVVTVGLSDLFYFSNKNCKKVFDDINLTRWNYEQISLLICQVIKTIESAKAYIAKEKEVERRGLTQC